MATTAQGLHLNPFLDSDYFRKNLPFLPADTREQLLKDMELRHPNYLLELCRIDVEFFIDNFCKLYDNDAKQWIPFRLWKDQKTILPVLEKERQVAVLKARRLGLTYLVLGLFLWDVIFHPIAMILLFSLREKDAEALLWEKMRGMYDSLPEFLKIGKHKLANNSEWILSNGSTVRAFPTTGGRSYTATRALVDEADYVPDLQRLLSAVQPTIDGGGQLILLSTSDKKEQESAFKKIYRSAMDGGGYAPVFLSWNARPERTLEWYDHECDKSIRDTGSLDYVWQEYPATVQQALAPNSLDKRIAPAWLEQCYVEMKPLADLPVDAPSIPGLKVYRLPEPWHIYVISGDSALGKEKSDDSASHVLDATTGEEVACIACKMEPMVHAGVIAGLSKWYNGAAVMIERNSMGWALLDHVRAFGVTILQGHDNEDGWLSSEFGKTILYNHAANAFRNREVILHSFRTYGQLASIEKSTLRAPKGMPDDESDSFSMCAAARLVVAQGAQFLVVQRSSDREAGQYGSWMRPRESGGSEKGYWRH